MNITEWEVSSSNISANVRSAVLTHLPQGGTFIDVGANVGAVSIAATPRAGLIVAFEPVGELYRRLSEALGPNAIVEQLALGDTPGVKQLLCDDTNRGWNTFETEQATPGMRSVWVEVVTFDSWADAHDLRALDVVKIDVEGYEYAVLRGMRSSLLRFHPVLVIEVGWGTGHPHRAAEVEQLEWLFDHGYERVDYDTDATTDFVLVPRA